MPAEEGIMHAQHITLNPVDWLTLVLVVIGALNWGLIGIAGFVGGNLNVVNLLLGGSPMLESLVYLIVGLAGVYMVYFGWTVVRAPSEMAERSDAEATAR